MGGVQRGETEDGHGAQDEAAGQCALPGVQGGAEPLEATGTAVLYGGRNLMTLLVDGPRFEDGILVELLPPEETASAA